MRFASLIRLQEDGVDDGEGVSQVACPAIGRQRSWKERFS
jgi:hypothetical protein